ncbi:MAG: alpha/beta hydrolase [Tenacibaculum sp.]
MSLQYIVKQVKGETKNPPLLILLHGYGSNEKDLFSFAEELPSNMLIVSVRAPHSISYGGYAWYAINFNGENGKFSDLVQARESIANIASFIDQIKEKYQSAADKTFLLGFSQGALLSYALSLNYPNKVQHVVALSGYINKELLPKTISTHIITDFYISHGISDPILPVEWARQAPAFLSKHKLRHEYSEYPMGHGVSPQNFNSFKNWIKARLI